MELLWVKLSPAAKIYLKLEVEKFCSLYITIRFIELNIVSGLWIFLHCLSLLLPLSHFFFKLARTFPFIHHTPININNGKTFSSLSSARKNFFRIFFILSHSFTFHLSRINRWAHDECVANCYNFLFIKHQQIMHKLLRLTNNEWCHLIRSNDSYEFQHCVGWMENSTAVESLSSNWSRSLVTQV